MRSVCVYFHLNLISLTSYTIYNWNNPNILHVLYDVMVHTHDSSLWFHLRAYLGIIQMDDGTN